MPSINNETVAFANEELRRYLTSMTGSCGDIKLSAGNDESLREECAVDVTGGKGKIKANNPRALLIGVYEFLRRNGCRFLRPEKDGEVVPKRKLSDISGKYVFVPASVHRGITIEGAVSLKHVIDLIDYAPKAGFNAYFTQFRTSYEFFSRWYNNSDNPYMKNEPITPEKAEEFVSEISREIEKRSLIRHAVGHGWTTGCLGLETNGWSNSDIKLSDDKTELLALIDGKREFFKGKPLNTHLCYSNARARELLASDVADYAEKHPEIDILHFWLADDYNNACECDECAKTRMADRYVRILNLINEKLTQKGLKTKIVFLVYFELYWPPETEKIKNPDRFILMFAPIFRQYVKSYDVSSAGKDAPMMKYDRNAVKYPPDPAVYLTFLAGWQKVFSGDSFDFDYHLMWDINRDFGGEKLTSVLFGDIRALKDIGLNGYVSCQIQRAFYPNGLSMYVLGRALTDGDVSYSELREEYYSAAFGKNSRFAEECFETLERCLPFEYFNAGGNTKEREKAVLGAESEIAELLGRFPKVGGENGAENKSAELLKFLLNNALRFSRVLALKISGADKEKVEAAKKEYFDYYNRNEEYFQTYTDGFYFRLITDGLIEQSQTGIYAD